MIRPVRELKGYRRVRLAPGASERVDFKLTTADLAYFDNRGKQVVEPGQFEAWIGGDSTAESGLEFELLPSHAETPAVEPAILFVAAT